MVETGFWHGESRAQGLSNNSAFQTHILLSGGVAQIPRFLSLLTLDLALMGKKVTSSQTLVSDARVRIPALTLNYSE